MQKVQLTKEQKLLVIGHLQKLGTGEIRPVRCSAGICDELSRRFVTLDGFTLVREYSWSWSKHSGIGSYPIPGFDGLCEIKSFDKVLYSDGDMWDDNTYGDDRRELCLHIAGELQRELLEDTKP